jgi:hypothetical protein
MAKHSGIPALGILMVLLAAAFSPLQPSRPALADQVAGYWDTMDNFTGAEGKDPTLVGFGGRLYNIYQLRTELYNPDGSRLGIRGDLYYSSFGGQNWSQPSCITPVNNDIYAHGCHNPYATEYKGKLYVTAEAIEPSIKDDTNLSDPNPVNNTDYDIILRVFDGAGWEPPLRQPMHVLSGASDGNVADQECRSIVFRDILYFVWMQIPAGPNGTTGGDRRIAWRTFDGARWGAVGVAAEDITSIYGDPSLAVYRDRLYVTVQTNTSTDRDIDIVCTSFDGAAWSARSPVNPSVAGSPAKRYNIISRLAVYRDRLWCVWESRDAIAKSSSDLDLMMSSTDGTAWGWPVVVNPARHNGDDFWPTMAAFNGSLYIAWSSNDPFTTDGQEDNDVVMRSFDGRNWSAITNVSPYGDNGTIGGEHNPGDDNQPYLYAWNGSLYCAWISFDQFPGGIGHPGAEFTTIVKRVAGGAGEGGGGDKVPTESGTVGTPGQFPWAVVAVLVIACVCVAGLVLFRRRPAGSPPSTVRTEKHNSPEGKD